MALDYLLLFPYGEDRWHLFNIRMPLNRCHGIELDNRWVVPHNVYLLTKYDAHINVEVCNNIRAVKYLFKCI